MVISSGEISRLLTNIPKDIEQELLMARELAIKIDPNLNIDATGMTLAGKTCHNLCHGNKFMSYHTLAKDRSRHEAVKALTIGFDPIYVLDDFALKWIKKRIKSNKIIKKIESICSSKSFSEDEFGVLIFSVEITKAQAIGHIKTGALRSAWQKNLLGPVPTVLISDAASEYCEILDYHQACWIHELRHYRFIKIGSEYIREELDEFFILAWDLFDLMDSYKLCPTVAARKKIEDDFKTIFERKWNSYMIEHCRKNTLGRKNDLLVFLDHPEIPIHNNSIESAIREKVVRRNISGGHKVLRGANAGNFWISLYQTTMKNGVSFFHFLRDRYRKLGEVATLSNIIESRYQKMALASLY